jgi:hypothetical protein
MLMAIIGMLKLGFEYLSEKCQSYRRQKSRHSQAVHLGF